MPNVYEIQKKITSFHKINIVCNGTENTIKLVKVVIQDYGAFN